MTSSEETRPSTGAGMAPSGGRSSSGEEGLHVDLGSYEGPLDLLLDLARRQKVDLAAISVLALAQQYLAFLDGLRDARVELAAAITR